MCRNPFAVGMSSIVLSLIVLVEAAPVAAQTVVHTCGQHTSGPATLATDLDCTGFDGTALTMDGGTLTMNGHTITGGFITVQCDRTCKIVGPGAVVGDGTSFIGLQAFGTGLKATQVSSSGYLYAGAQVWESAVIEGPAVFSGNGVGLRVGRKAKLKDLTITGNLDGVNVGDNSRNGSIVARGCTVSGNDAAGLYAQQSIKVDSSTVTDNGEFGIYGSGGFSCERKAGATLKTSTVTGNGTAPECGVSQPCADVATCSKRPRVKTGATCGTSYQVGSGIPGATWGVCALD